MDRFSNIGVIKNGPEFDLARIEHFESAIAAMRKRGSRKRGVPRWENIGMDENAVEVANARFEILRSRLRQLLPDAEVILFGSRARGDAGESSDYDLLIIVGDQFSVSEKRKLASAIQNDLAASGIDADILVRSNVEVDVAKRRVCSVVHEAFKEGLRL